MQVDELKIGHYYVGESSYPYPFVARITGINELGDQTGRWYEIEGQLAFYDGGFWPKSNSLIKAEWIIGEIEEAAFDEINCVGGEKAGDMIFKLYKEAMAKCDMDVRHYICD